MIDCISSDVKSNYVFFLPSIVNTHLSQTLGYQRHFSGLVYSASYLAIVSPIG